MIPLFPDEILLLLRKQLPDPENSEIAKKLRKLFRIPEGKSAFDPQYYPKALPVVILDKDHPVIAEAQGHNLGIGARYQEKPTIGLVITPFSTEQKEGTKILSDQAKQITATQLGNKWALDVSVIQTTMPVLLVGYNFEQEFIVVDDYLQTTPEFSALFEFDSSQSRTLLLDCRGGYGDSFIIHGIEASTSTAGMFKLYDENDKIYWKILLNDNTTYSTAIAPIINIDSGYVQQLYIDTNINSWHMVRLMGRRT